MDERKAHYVTATAIVVRDGKYLIAKRSLKEKAFPGKWTVPGGKLEVSDYTARPKDTRECWYNVLEGLVKREVLEETGLEIKNLGYLTSMAFIRPDNVPGLILSFHAEHGGGEVKLNGELTEHAWVTLEGAKKYDLIDGILEEIELLDGRLKGKKAESWAKK
ncbi:MAG TPA: NUDIX domain-containing protein [archaeon]|nr:NUDIX domain-containing protein [archaeon]HLD80683.1 NUDIX domain-containing protein [archaeon]